MLDTTTCNALTIVILSLFCYELLFYFLSHKKICVLGLHRAQELEVLWSPALCRPGQSLSDSWVAKEANFPGGDQGSLKENL